MNRPDGDPDGPAVQTSGRPSPGRWFVRQQRLLVTGRWFLLAGSVGVMAGVGAILFFSLSHWLFETLMGGVADYDPIVPRGESGDPGDQEYKYGLVTISPLWCVLLPALGGLVVGWIVFTWAPEAQGHGTDGAVDAYHNQQGRIGARVIWVKTLASAITLGTGGSGGREGPIAQIGAGFGSWFATRLRLSNRERRVLLAVGMGAGVSAIFRAPLAGALFAAEILYRDPDFESEVIMPSLLGSIISYSIFTGWSGQGSLFKTDLLPNAELLVFDSPIELLPYLALGLILVAFVMLYVKGFYGIEHAFRRLPIKPHFKPMIGGALTGGLALALWTATGDGRVLSLLSFGYAAIQEPFDLLQGDVAWGLAGVFLLVAVGKIVTTGLTIGSGGSAGVFGPSMVIGGAVGGAVGIAFNLLWPDIAPHPGAFAIVGMAGFFTGCANPPISTLLMVSEITGDYSLLVPTMGCCAITFSICRKTTIYGSQVQARKDSPAHRGDFIHDVLEGIWVSDLVENLRPPQTIGASTSLRELVRIVPEGHSQYYPVVDERAALVGIISLNDVRRYLHDDTVWDVLVALDIMTTPVIAVTPTDDLSSALRRFTQKNIGELPVVDPEDTSRLLGMLRRHDVIAAYNALVAPVDPA
ncbi:MAG: chloride channel protein [Planctomycetes bacterium]|nr:chloride channel protein [Planctomycetota bacterium]